MIVFEKIIFKFLIIFILYKLIDISVVLIFLVFDVIIYVVGELMIFYLKGDVCVRRILRENKNFFLMKLRCRKKFERWELLDYFKV